MRVAATRLAAVGSIAVSAGCFYVEPVNQRPSLDIRARSSAPVFRGAVVGFEAIASDPEKQAVSFQWRAYVCDDATTFASCDREPIFTGIEPTAEFRVPAFRADPDGEGPQLAVPVQSLRVVLEGKDDRGAVARPEQVETVPVLNHPPDLELRAVSMYRAVVNTPIEVYAKYGDRDDTAEHVSLAWTAFSPSQVPGPLTEIAVPQDPNDPAHLQRGVRFTPAVTGNWDLRVIATDRFGAEVEKHLIVTVAEDAPPCLDAWEPLASPEPSPLTEPTLFRVHRVDDDLDAFPRAPGAPDFIGEVEFEWSLRVGAGPRQPLPNAGSGLALDPAVYEPGTILELRVETFDRKATAITCADEAPTCSVISQASCLQRQTWRVEAR